MMRRSKAQRAAADLGAWPFGVCLLVFSLVTLPTPTASGSDETRIRIALAHDAIPAEATAAEELAVYLERATRASFPVTEESDGVSEGPSIHVGPTAFAARHGIDAAALGPEEWVIKSERGSLILCGGRPRGTLYAVYRFLEDRVGVRWWTPWDETVPRQSKLTIPKIDVRGEPVFSYRDVYGIDGPREFHARSRLNGDHSGLRLEHGGRESYGPPFPVHNFYLYVPPAEYFESRPEYDSELDGVRTHDKAQLCLTNSGLRELVASKLERDIDQAHGGAAQRGERPSRLYGFSKNDWGGDCRCDACRRVVKRQGGEAGPLVEFVNYLAERIEEKYPDVLLDTLGYHQTFHPPRSLVLRDNVVIRVSALQKRDFSKPVIDPVHWEYREALHGWSKRTKHLRVWDYSVTFGRRANLPLPNLPVLAADFRFYHERGVEGLYIQHDGPILADMRDLKLWVLLKLMEDPYRDLDALVVDFTDGYYGAAGETLREYLSALDRAAARKPSRIGYPARPSQYRYLDTSFLVRAHELFDRAEQGVRDDPRLSRRVRQARLSLDRATLMRWSGKLGRSLDPEPIARRYRRTAHELVDLRLRENRREKRRAEIDRELRKLWNAIE